MLDPAGKTIREIGELEMMLAAVQPTPVTPLLSINGRPGVGKTVIGKTVFAEHDAVRLLFRYMDISTKMSSRKYPGFSSASTKYYAEGDVNGSSVEALPDSGADTCVISQRLATNLDITPIAGTRKMIHFANKKHIDSPGMVTVPWRFATEQSTHMLNCWILPESTHDLILGNQFLRITQTLTKFTGRIKSKLVPPPGRLRVNLLNDEKQRLQGLLNGHITTALPDTGSDVMLISSEYARKIGLHVDRGFKSCIEVEFPDGTTEWTSGIVRDVPWTVGETTIRCDFHVLDDLCVDVVLSKNYLFDLDVFSKHEEYFFNVDSGADISHLCNIRLLGRYGDALNTLEEEYLEDVNSPVAFTPDMIQRELVRRDQIRDEIMALSEYEQEAASEAEAERQRRWQDMREISRRRVGAESSSIPQCTNEHGDMHRTEIHRDQILESPARSTEAVVGDDLQRSVSRREMWKKRVRVISISLRHLRRNTRA
ncbi:hypothetical protein QQS21_007267 [Conoideocrella luteorostrata]|uniref:Uncharacterized protein n=1 Tax=Conoideocrella luteorostrata TaxID=1105319 RepID=A0AAJ0CL18_9HYPO|nr:hypothetical protein QQS21_007267 [Conoideocrella luteorostrata]